MRELTLNDQVVVFDREATAAVYRNIDVLGTDVCTCNSCKNFRQFRHVAYGPKLLDLLDRLGIDPLKEWEVYWAGEDHRANGYIYYGGWFVFVGDWVTKTDPAKQQVRKEESFSFTDNFPNGTKQFGPQPLAVEFFVQIPKASDYVSDLQ